MSFCLSDSILSYSFVLVQYMAFSHFFIIFLLRTYTQFSEHAFTWNSYFSCLLVSSYYIPIPISLSMSLHWLYILTLFLLKLQHPSLSLQNWTYQLPPRKKFLWCRKVSSFSITPFISSILLHLFFLTILSSEYNPSFLSWLYSLSYISIDNLIVTS